MKSILLALIIIVAANVTIAAQSAKKTDALEQKIRTLELAEADAVLRQDFEWLEKTWAEEYTVNAPNNQVSRGRAEVLKIFRAGIANYSSFAREIESVAFHKNTVIVMGMETVKPINKAPFAGQTLRRRYTNVWMKKNGKWLLVARHASIICPN